MAPIPKSVFRRRLRDLPEEVLADFVAALWRARGREVTRERGVILTTDPASGATERLQLPPFQDGMDRSAPGAGVDRDRVVLPAKPRGSRLRPGRHTEPAAADTVTSDDLYQLLHFALDTHTADRITTEHLGIPFHRDPPTGEETGRPTATTPDHLSQAIQTVGRTVRPAVPSRGLVLAGVTLLLLAGVLGVAALQNAPPDPTVAGETDDAIPSGYETPTAIPDPAEESTSLGPSPRLAETVDDGFRIDRPQTPEAYPPGLGP
ncbi:MAG: hypothetical protein R3324_05450, partial [Halobacteriales archaeon]|nr:hypothetical protein [Halobacteriales archaeon]